MQYICRFNNSTLSQTFRRFGLFRNLSSRSVLVHCIMSALNRRRLRGRTVLCKLSWVLEVSVDVSLLLKST